jgi:6-phosphogluconolactonase
MHKTHLLPLLAACGIILSACGKTDTTATSTSTPAMSAPAPAATDYFIYYGTSNGGAGNGLSVGRFNAATGVLSAPTLAAQAEGPSFFVVAADGKHLYSCWENADKIAAYEIDPATGALKFLNSVASGGSGPCHISLDATGHYALVANYNSGSVAAFQIQPDFSLGAQTGADQHHGKSVDPARQEGPHAHCVITDPSNKFALCTDLGTDQIFVYKFDAATGSLTPNTPAFGTVKPGSGPRHLRFSPDGKVLYCINEMGGSITAFNWDGASGTMTEFQTISTLPADFTAFNKDAEMAIDPSGKFLYASARGHDSIAVFAIDPKTDGLSLVQDISSGGKTPRFIGFDPSGKWLLAGNQDNNAVAVFSLDAKTGKLAQQGQPLTAPAPICLGFIPAPAKTP